MRLAKTFTIEPDINEYLDETKGDRSASERVNELLRRAIIEEQYERLEAEAAAFFADDSKADRAETKAMRKASLRTFSRD
jgi:predicted CopG family antitoxin